METAFTRLLQIQHPLIQAPIGSASNPVLASEVSNAGALGMLALSWKSEQECRTAIQTTKALTKHPFGVNLVLEWEQEKRINICIQEKVPIVSFCWGDGSRYIEKLHQHGIKVCQTVSSAKEAAYYAGKGTDFLIAQGWEAGGHVEGSVASSVLIPAVASQVNIPILAAGGFANGSGLVAAIALGASGVCMGTRFLLSKEAGIEPQYAEYIQKAKENDTVYLENLFNKGWENAPHRVIRNSTVKKWEAAGKPQMGDRPNENEVIGYDPSGEAILSYSDNNPITGTTGTHEAMALYAGQTSGLLKNQLTAKKIVQKTIEEAEDSLKQLNALS